MLQGGTIDFNWDTHTEVTISSASYAVDGTDEEVIRIFEKRTENKNRGVHMKVDRQFKGIKTAEIVHEASSSRRIFMKHIRKNQQKTKSWVTYIRWFCDDWLVPDETKVVLTL